MTAYGGGGSRTLRSAFVNQPWNRASPPVDEGSVAIWTFEVARALGPDACASVVSRRIPEQPAESRHDGVDYLRVPSWPEPFGPVARLRGALSNGGIPRFAAGGYYGAYFRRAARRLAHWNPDVVHVHNLFQAMPVLRRRLPRAQFVLHKIGRAHV